MSAFEVLVRVAVGVVAIGAAIGVIVGAYRWGHHRVRGAVRIGRQLSSIDTKLDDITGLVGGFTAQLLNLANAVAHNSTRLAVVERDVEGIKAGAMAHLHRHRELDELLRHIGAEKRKEV